MDARPVDRGLRLEPLVEDPGDDLQERAAQPRPAGSANREDEPSPSRARVGAIMLCHPLAGLERHR